MFVKMEDSTYGISLIKNLRPYRSYEIKGLKKGKEP